ncbi:MAG: hypothetical protein KDB61_16025, partial [Planctomycetes bacterium]|nr:hypothetical protein [Planctomycetota bacterium]
MSPHEDPSSEPAKPKKSFGNMGPDHWTQAREDANGEDIACYRERSRAPGVAQGGGSRNFYCMECDGVIPSDPPQKTCPHCGVAIRGEVGRHFDRVEIATPPASDWKALRP